MLENYTEEQLFQKLEKADAAGDEYAAKQFAQMIREKRAMSQGQQQMVEQTPIEQPKIQTEYEKAKELAKDIPASQFTPVQEPKPQPMSREAQTSNWQGGSSYYQMGNVDRKTQEDVAKEIAIRETAPFIEEAKQVMMDNPDKYVGRTVFDVAQELGQASRAASAAETAFATATLGVGAPTALGIKGVGQAAKLGAILGSGQEAAKQATEAAVLGDADVLDPIRIAQEGGIGALFGGGLQTAFDAKNLIGQTGLFDLIGKRAAKNISPDKLAGVQAAAEHNKQLISEKMIDAGVNPTLSQRFINNRGDLTQEQISEIEPIYQKAFKEAKKDFIEFTPSQIADKGLGVRMEQLSNITPNMPFVDSSTSKMLAKQTTAAEKAASDIAKTQSDIAESSVERGRMFAEAKGLPYSAKENTPDSFLGSIVSDISTEMKQRAGDIYKNNMRKLDEAFKNSPVKITQLKPTQTIQLAKDILSEQERLGALGLSKNYQRQIKDLIKQKPKDFSELDGWKKLLNKKASEAYTKGDFDASDAFKQLSRSIKEDAQIHADALGADIGNIYKEADMAWGEAMDVANNKYLKSLVNTNFDADTVRKMIRGESGAEKIKEVYSAINQSENPVLQTVFQDSVLSTIMKEANMKALGDRTSDFNAGAFGKVIRQNQKQIEAAAKNNKPLAKNIKSLGDMFDLMRKADIERGPIQQAIKGLGSKVGGGVAIGEAAFTGGVPILTGLAMAGNKLADMSAAKLGKIMTKYSDEFAKFEKEKNVYLKQEYAEKILKGILATDEE